MERLLRSHLAFLLPLFIALLAPADLVAQRTISGTVVDRDTQAPVPFVQIGVVGTTRGTVAEEDGRFVLTGVPDGTVTLRLQSLGHRTLDIPVPASQDVIEIVLTTDYLKVDEIIVTGRATSLARRNAANSVSTVSAAEIERVPAQSVEKQIQGKVAGADIQKNSGAPGGGIQVNLRGVSSINGASEPLYVVDGIIVSNAAVVNNQDVVLQSTAGSNKSILQQDQVNRISDIPPEDIESIEILKGASASAIYGSKASNGVVIITTKRGRPGPPRVDITQRLGVFDLSEKLDFRTFRNNTVEEVVEVFGELAREPFLAGQVFDHEEQLAGQHDVSSETIVSISGGDENTTYYASGAIKNNEGVVINTGYELQSMRVNVEQQLDERLTIGVNTSVIHSLAQRGFFNNDNFLVTPYFALGFIPRFFDLTQRADGSFPEPPFGGGTNPLQTFELAENEEDVWRILGAVDLGWDIWRQDDDALQLLASGGVDWFRQKNDLLFPPELFFEPADGQPGTSLISDSDNLNLNSSINLVYTHSPGAYTSRTSGGFQYEERDLNIARIVAQNLIAGQPNVSSGTNVQVAERRELVKDAGFYGQEELLLLNERLTLTGAIRGEQSSANGDDEELFWYPKASASLRFPEVSDTFDEIKLRIAYGESGNQPLFGQKFVSLNATQNIAGNPGLTINSQVGDPNITPERTREIEFGVDMNLFNGNAVLDATFYQQNITDLLLERQIAPSSGFESQFFNGGELRVRGFELAFGVTPVRTNDVLWVSRTLFSTDRAEITDLPVPDFVLNAVFGAGLGDFQIAQGEDPTKWVGTVDGELQIVGDTNPDFKMSFSNDVTWGEWTFYTLWDWAPGADVLNLTAFLNDLGQTTNDFEANGADRLAATGPVYIEDAGFVKLRELTVSYELPVDWVQTWWPWAQRARLSFSGRDLLTFTDYSGLDPEVSNFGNQPIARNVDTSAYPPSRSYWFSVDLGF